MDPKNIRVADIMSERVLTLRTTTTLRDAMTALASHGIGGAPVADDRGACVGIFSVADASTAPSNDATVAECMTKDVKVVSPTTSVEAAARQMLRAGAHRLLVLDEGAIVGIISSMDIVRLAAGYARAEQPEPEIAF